MVSILDEVFEDIATANANVEQKLAALDALKKSLVYQAFSGVL